MIHHVFANKSNIGDWLSARGIQRLLGQPVVEHFCDEPFVEGTLSALARCTKEDLVVIGGGGLFMDYFEPFWRGLLKLSPELRYCIWGVGYCDLKREPSRPATGLIEEVVAQATLCVVRDELTRQHLAASTLCDPIPCPSIAALEPDVCAARGLLHVDNYTTAGSDVFELMDAQGRAFAQGTGRTYRRTNNRLERVTEASLTGIVDRYRDSDIVLSSALHGCIVAVALGKQVLAVSGDHKIEGFMHAAGLGDWVLDVTQVDEVPERLEAISAQPDVRAFLPMAVAANRQVAAAIVALASGHSRPCEVSVSTR